MRFVVGDVAVVIQQTELLFHNAKQIHLVVTERGRKIGVVMGLQFKGGVQDLPLDVVNTVVYMKVQIRAHYLYLFGSEHIVFRTAKEIGSTVVFVTAKYKNMGYVSRTIQKTRFKHRIHIVLILYCFFCFETK